MTETIIPLAGRMTRACAIEAQRLQAAWSGRAGLFDELSLGNDKLQ